MASALIFSCPTDVSQAGVLLHQGERTSFPLISMTSPNKNFAAVGRSKKEARRCRYAAELNVR
jgi:hypothetical protein